LTPAHQNDLKTPKNINLKKNKFLTLETKPNITVLSRSLQAALYIEWLQSNYFARERLAKLGINTCFSFSNKGSLTYEKFP